MTAGLPPTSQLTYEQYSGRACCWCARPLTTGAVSAGISRGRHAAHILDTEVYACPACASERGLIPKTPAAGEHMR